MANISNPQLIKQLLMALARIKKNVVVDAIKSYYGSASYPLFFLVN